MFLKPQLNQVNKRFINGMPALTSSKFSTTATKGDLYKYQTQLPHLPVPSLEDSAAKYLSSVKPFLSAAQFKTTESKVRDFIKPDGVGQVLQKRLLDLQANPKTDNWLAEWWDDYAYMGYRDPVVPYVSYFFSHKDIRNEIGHNQLQKAALIAYYATEFLSQVETETLQPEIIKNNPYCMNAFKYMFNTSRVPDVPADKTVMYPAAENRFFVVIINNHFYKIYHHNTAGTALSKQEILKQLQYIYQDSATRSVGPAVGALTSLDRDSWYSAYNTLLKNPINTLSLDIIHASSFVICLDKESPITILEKSDAYWHGDGKNRFYDKPLEFIISANGNSGFLGEHSRMDATPTVQLNNYIVDKLFKEDSKVFKSGLLSNVEDIAVESAPSILPFDIDVTTKTNIANAIKTFDATVAAHDHKVWQYYGFGKNLIKTFKVSPDAFVQMLMQLSYYKLTGKVRPTYESAATRKFLKGRTETGRSVSPDSVNFVKTWTDFSATKAEKIAAFQKASASHVKYISDASNGHGVDRHFFGLKQLIQEGESVPEIFTDPVFGYSATWFLSTSQIPSPYFQSWGFSQVIEEGFGLAYMINNDWLHVNISCKKGNGLSSDHLDYYLTETANELREILSSAEPIKAKL